MEGQKLGHRSILGERHGLWLSHSATQSLTEPIHVSDTATYSQHGSARCAIFRMQGAAVCVMVIA